jgi:hypothetical protein
MYIIHLKVGAKIGQIQFEIHVFSDGRMGFDDIGLERINKCHNYT